MHYYTGQQRRGNYTVPELYANGYALYHGGKYHEALAFFQILVGIDPTKVKFWMALGATHQMLQDYNEAISSYAVAGIIDNEQVVPYPPFHAAECLIAIENFEKAFVALNSAKTIAKKNATKYSSLIDRVDALEKAWEDKKDTLYGF